MVRTKVEIGARADATNTRRCIGSAEEFGALNDKKIFTPASHQVRCESGAAFGQLHVTRASQRHRAGSRAIFRCVSATTGRMLTPLGAEAPRYRYADVTTGRSQCAASALAGRETTGNATRAEGLR